MEKRGSYIRVEKLKKLFRKAYALKDINFDIKEKGLYLFLGENGSGKTTLLKILSFLLFPSGGKIYYLDEETEGKEHKFLKNIGFSTHNPFLYPDLTCYENLEFVRKFYNVKKEKIFELAEKFKTGEYMKKKIKELSRGQVQRISLIRAILHDPFFLFLDEPFNSLDRVGIKILEDFITENLDKKVILISSHIHFDIFEKKKRIFYLKKGEITEVD